MSTTFFCSLMRCLVLRPWMVGSFLARESTRTGMYFDVINYDNNVEFFNST